MKKIIIDFILKGIALFLCVYFLIILSKIADRLENGRYQFDSEGYIILDTKTGKLYRSKAGNLIERK